MALDGIEVDKNERAANDRAHGAQPCSSVQNTGSPASSSTRGSSSTGSRDDQAWSPCSASVIASIACRSGAIDSATAWGDFFLLDALVHAVEPEQRLDPLGS